MNFSGYIPLHREIIGHTIDGRLSSTEALVLVWLTMLADKSTGRGTINAPTLRFYLPGLTKGGAQRTLESLERKRYIYRDVVPRSPLAYPYWIQGFKPTFGKHKSSSLDLSQMFHSRDVSRVRYTGNVPATSPAGELGTSADGEPDGANYNEKREVEKREQRSETTPIFSTTPLPCASNYFTTTGRTTPTVTQYTPGNSSSTSHATPRLTPPQLPFGMIWRDGQVFTTEGTLISANSLAVLLDGPGERT